MCARCQDLHVHVEARFLRRSRGSHGTVDELPMTKSQDARWDEPSEPEISIGALIQAHAEDFKGNIIGERFGKYLLVGEIAVGGMAELFLAVHRGVEGFIKAVVLQRVLPPLHNNPEFVRMFVDEARLAAPLRA